MILTHSGGFDTGETQKEKMTINTIMINRSWLEMWRRSYDIRESSKLSIFDI